MEIFIIGAGGHAKQCIDIFEENNYGIIGLFDDDTNKIGTLYYGYKVMDKIDNLSKYLSDASYLFCAIGNNHDRKRICEKYKHFKFTQCISQRAFISNSINFNKRGNYVGHNALLLANVQINNFNIINDGCIVPHDCIIGDYNHLSIRSVLGGRVVLRDLNLCGLNCTILPDIIIGSENIIGAGAVVIKNVDDNKIIVGNPGKIINNLE